MGFDAGPGDKLFEAEMEVAVQDSGSSGGDEERWRAGDREPSVPVPGVGGERGGGGLGAHLADQAEN